MASEQSLEEYASSRSGQVGAWVDSLPDEIFNQAFSIVQEFYLTRIYGNYQCDKSINIIEVQNSMTLDKKIDCDETCHFEIWKK